MEADYIKWEDFYKELEQLGFDNVSVRLYKIIKPHKKITVWHKNKITTYKKVEIHDTYEYSEVFRIRNDRELGQLLSIIKADIASELEV